MRDLEPLGSQVREELGVPSDAWLQKQRSNLNRALVLRSPSRRPWALAAAIAVACSALLFWGTHVRDRANGPRLALSSMSREQRVPLADGSSLVLTPHTRAQLTTDAVATRCVIEVGTVSFDVAPQGSRSFAVIAGAIEVRVIGTQFSVSRSEVGLVEVRVVHGIVRVLAPGRSAPVELRAGDHFRADGAALSLTHPTPPIDAKQPAADPGASITRDGNGEESLAVEEHPSSTPALGATNSRDDWVRLYRERRYVEAVRAARQAGIEGLLNGLPVQKLTDLADAARLAGDGELALRALTTVGRRFPASRQAQDATFLSGRILATRGQPAMARTKFEAYLAKNPQGAYAMEAMGRLVELYSASGDARAKSTARAYLQRSPHGPYQRLCDSVLAAP